MAVKHIDEILTTLGNGKWNLIYYFGFGLCGFMIPAFVFSGTFLTPVIEFECIPTDDTNVTKVNECTYFTSLDGNDTSKLEHKCTKWKFSDDIFPTSLTAEFQLVCDKAHLRPMFQTTYMIGTFISAPINGFLSDRFGRKTLFSFGAGLVVASILVSSYLTNFTALLVFRFLAGIAHSPLIHTGYILCIEVCEPGLRSVVGIILSLPWALGTIWWGVLGYLIDDWRWLLRAAVVPGAIYLLSFMWLIDESPRWLIVAGDHYKALKVLNKAARWNKVTLPSDDELLEKMKEIQKSAITEVAKSSASLSNSTSWKLKVKLFINYIYILYKTSELRRITLLIYVAFFVAATVFYGLSLNAANFKLDPYMYVIVGGLMEVPAYTLSIPIVIKFGRVRPTLASYLICGVAIIALAFIQDTKWLIYTLAMSAKLCISAAYQIIYLIASEVFPTEVRLQGLGTSNFISRIGTILSPFITDGLGHTYPWSPSVVFGIISICAGVATYFLPETNNKNLPETIVQLEAEAKLASNRNKTEDGTAEEKQAVV